MAYTVTEVRAAEQALMATVPDGTLMQRAAAGLAAVSAGLLGQVYGSRVVILAGSGDSGGDALFAGARLARRGARVTAIAAGSRLHEAGAGALRSAGGRVIAAVSAAEGAAGNGAHAAAAGTGAQGPAGTAAQGRAGGEHAVARAVGGLPTPPMREAAAHLGAITATARAEIAAADLIIDGLTGIGGSGGLREPGASLAVLTEAARGDGSVVVAVDLPSGISADTGEVEGAAVSADVTVTFGTWKPGLLIDPGAEMAGAAQLVDIGLGPYLGDPAVVALQAADVAAVLPSPTSESDKYRRGVLGVVAGSGQYTGAAVLATGSAIHGGAGMVRLVSSSQVLQAVRQYWPEAVLTEDDDKPGGKAIEAAGRVQAWVAGPGMGTGPDAASRLAAVLATSLPVLVDADGITILSEHPDLLRRDGPTLITPHAGELGRLLKADRNDIEARRLHYATTAARELGVTVLLKGSTTVIATPDPGEPVLVNPTGTSWLATAGSGDVLSGLTGALLAQGAAPASAAAAGAYLHGIAGRLAAEGAPIGAADIIKALPAAIRSVTQIG
jgi:ADP-dependent NAD(P)H-hydrate dehydratase / NAD(P)H-hydrate epimerase